MGYYQDLYEKSKKTGVSQTRDGGTVTTKPKNSGANTVSSASANLGAGKATGGITGGDTGYKNSTKKSSGGSKSSGSSVSVPKTTTPTLTYSAPTVSFTPVVQPAKTTTTNVKKAVSAVDGSKIATEAYKKKLAANQRRTTNQGMYDDNYEPVKKNPNTGGVRAYGANDVAMMSANLDQRAPASGANNTTTQSANLGQNLTTGAVNGRYQLPAEYNRYNENTVLELLNKFNVTPEQVGMPLEYLYYGGNSYMGAPHLLRYSNDTVIQDHNGNRITVGDLRYALQNGLYMQGNEAAYNNWVGGVSQNERANTVDPYEYEEDFGGDDYGIDDYAQAIIDAQNAQYAALLQQLQNQSGVLNQQYDNNAANLYAQYRRSGLAMPELMAGTATGIADSYTLQNNLNFQNNLNANELERAAAQNELNAQANEIQAQSELQAAQTAAEWAQMAYQQRQAEREAEREYQLALAKANASNTTSKPSLTASQAMSAWENGYDTDAIREALLYYYGYIPAVAAETTQTVTPTTVSGQTVLPTNPLTNKIEEGMLLNNLLRLNGQK